MKRVLVPGSGLGRLALEICARGYATQGNEFAYFMLIVSNFLLNAREEVRVLMLRSYPLELFHLMHMLRMPCAPLLAGGIHDDQPLH